jgi:hypothetical protein
MDHETLIELGITSVGQRLNLLRAVWELKRDQGIDISDDEWKPQGEEAFVEVKGSDGLS